MYFIIKKLINTDLEYIFKIIEEDKILYEKNNTMMSIFFIILSAIKLYNISNNLDFMKNIIHYQL